MAAEHFSPGGPVVLLTDFGVADPYVGVMHGVLASLAPSVRVIDLTHGVPAQDVRLAARFLASSRTYFPRGSIFVAVVDPGVGSARAIVAACDEGRLYLAPDNGLVAPSVGTGASVRRVEHSRFALAKVSATFHGRDVFCPLAARLANGELRFEDVGPETKIFERVSFPAPVRTARGLRGVVEFADRFGNLITNVEPGELDGELRSWRAKVAGRSLEWVTTYAEAREGVPSLLVNSYGLLEIAVAGGSAERILCAGAGSVVEFER
ncbi:MAG TPA: SAM-dependent chlorinase/fluorinase [Planctomycetota bacterium]|nr:SAM-dependent chlorinase/fluorinase [Planctomycetota bacterium]